MKKIITSFTLLLAIVTTASAQLNIKKVNSVSERFYKDTWVTVTWDGSAFMFNSSDPVTALTLSFTLGKDKTSALTTLQQIYDWFKTAENKTSITFEDNGTDITLYKADGMEIVISTGDPEFIRKEFNRRISGALVGTYQYKKKESTPHFSYIREKALLRPIEAISALTDPKYGATSTPVLAEQISETPEESVAKDTIVVQTPTDSTASVVAQPTDTTRTQR